MQGHSHNVEQIVDTSGKQFLIHVSDTVLDDLRSRLHHRRRAVTSGSSWSLGTDAGFLERFLDYWQSQYDWRAGEAILNRAEHRFVDLGDVTIHAMFYRSDVRSALPLVLTHGWPSSPFEFMKVVENLTHPDEGEFAFDVIVPSLPGFGLSTIPDTNIPVVPPMIANWWCKMMDHLGYHQFVAAGGDIGSHVTNALGANHAERVIGIFTHHPNLHPVLGDVLSPEVSKYLERRRNAPIRYDFTYGPVQEHQADSLSPGLSDSPYGLAAWILDKYHAWVDHSDDLTSIIDLETLAHIVTWYWVTNSIGSSFRPYIDDSRQSPLGLVAVPAGISLTPEDADMPREFAELTYRDIRQWRGAEQGGHFLPLENPARFVKDVRDFFSHL